VNGLNFKIGVFLEVGLSIDLYFSCHVLVILTPGAKRAKQQPRKNLRIDNSDLKIENIGSDISLLVNNSVYFS
jgi:hypothetical protein